MVINGEVDHAAPELEEPLARISVPLVLLLRVVDLTAGDWVVQNVANSAVGRLVIALAKPRGVRTLNVVRRESLFAELAALVRGASLECLVCGEFVLHVRGAIACPECRSILAEGREVPDFELPSAVQAG